MEELTDYTKFLLCDMLAKDELTVHDRYVQLFSANDIDKAYRDARRTTIHDARVELPEYGKVVLVCDSDCNIGIAFRKDQESWDSPSRVNIDNLVMWCDLAGTALSEWLKAMIGSMRKKSRNSQAANVDADFRVGDYVHHITSDGSEVSGIIFMLEPGCAHITTGYGPLKIELAQLTH
jgi:hypothetical protein